MEGQYDWVDSGGVFYKALVTSGNLSPPESIHGYLIFLFKCRSLFMGSKSRPNCMNTVTQLLNRYLTNESEHTTCQWSNYKVKFADLYADLLPDQFLNIETNYPPG